MAKKDDVAAATEVAKVDANANAVALNSMYEDDAGSGFEEAGANSYAIPFLQILQSGSPQCKKSDGAYIKGAEEGKFFNTVTQEIFDGEEGIIVIPCHYSQRLIEWKPRESGGGFVGEHLPSENLQTRKDDKGRDLLPNGNTLVDTRNHYVLIKKADGTLTPALITMSSTQLKKSRQWMSKMSGIKFQNKATGAFATAPMFSRYYRLTTVAESNDKGSWFGFSIALEGEVSSVPEYNEAKAFRDAVRTGAAQTQYVDPSEEGTVAGESVKEQF